MLGPFVLRLTLEAPPEGIEKRVGELDEAPPPPWPTFAVYRLRDNLAAKDMSAEFTAQYSGVEHEIAGDPNVPEARCLQADTNATDVPGYACRLVVDNVYTVVRANTEPSAREITVSQYALLATR